jgi:tripeptidyl-peptidase-1
MIGTTVIYSTGDHGVAGFGNACLNASRKASESSRVSKVFAKSLQITKPAPRGKFSIPNFLLVVFQHKTGELFSLVSVLKATCPFVTAVGATQINPGSTINDPEGACEQAIFSGGGFSNIFPFVSPYLCNEMN